MKPRELYSKRVKKVADWKDGATVLVSSSRPDWERVLSILSQQRVSTLKPGTNIETADFKDIADNPKRLKFKYSFDPKILPELYKNDEGNLIAINSNFSVEAKVDPKSAVALETTDSPYSNIVVINKEDKNNKKIKLLFKELKKESTQKLILKKWHGAVLPVK